MPASVLARFRTITVFRGSLIVRLLMVTTAAPEMPASSAAFQPPTVMLQTFAPREAMPMLEQRVVEQAGKTVARLIDVPVDPNGQPVAAVLDFGGFRGVVVRAIALHRSALHVEPRDGVHRINLALTKDQFEAALEYKDPEKLAHVVVPVVPDSKPGQP